MRKGNEMLYSYLVDSRNYMQHPLLTAAQGVTRVGSCVRVRVSASQDAISR
jgi:hypothetical protein